MSTARKTYTEEFKREAMSLLEKHGNKSRLARKLGVHASANGCKVSNIVPDRRPVPISFTSSRSGTTVNVAIPHSAISAPMSSS